MTASTATLRIHVEGGINWQWYSARVGNLIARFRLHHDEDQIALMHRKYSRYFRIKPVGELGVIVATYYGKKEEVGGYSKPEVTQAFKWLNDLFRKTADSSEKGSCSMNPEWRHLEYHGVQIYRAKGTTQ